MGRRKIEILPIQHDRNRSVTFLKRKNGLFKKAYELGVLCSVDVAVIIFGHNNKVYEYCSTDSDTIVQRRLHYTGERDVKTPADFGGDKANNDDDEDGSDEPAAVASASRIAPGANKFPANGKKRTRDDEPSHLDYTSPGHLLHLQQPPASSSRTTLPNISALARGPPPVSLPLPPYASIQAQHQHHHHQPSSTPHPHAHSHAHSADALMEREREREREREGALRQLGLQHLLNSTASNPNSNNAGQYPPHPSHPSLVPNLNLASLLQAHPLLGLGVPGLNLGLGGLLASAGGGGGGSAQQDLIAMLSANAANVGGGNALYSNPLFSTLFPNHPLGNDNNGGGSGSGGGGGGGGSHSASNGAGDSKGVDLWPTLSRNDNNPAPVSTSSGAGGGGDASWLSFLGNSRGSQPPSDDVDLSSLFPFDPSAPSNSIGSVGVGDDADDDERGGKRTKR